MSAPLPDALRVRFQKLIEEGLSGRAAALRLKLSPATGAHWSLAIRQTGAARAAPQGRPKGKGKLADQQPFLLEVVEHDGDITMPELAAALLDATGVQTHPGSIGRFLRKLVFTYKKKTLVATERRRARAGAPRHQMEGQLATIAEHGAHDPIEVSGKTILGPRILRMLPRNTDRQPRKRQSPDGRQRRQVDHEKGRLAWL
jgi:transposase